MQFPAEWFRLPIWFPAKMLECDISLPTDGLRVTSQIKTSFLPTITYDFSYPSYFARVGPPLLPRKYALGTLRAHLPWHFSAFSNSDLEIREQVEKGFPDSNTMGIDKKKK